LAAHQLTKWPFRWNMSKVMISSSALCKSDQSSSPTNKIPRQQWWGGSGRIRQGFPCSTLSDPWRRLRYSQAVGRMSKVKKMSKERPRNHGCIFLHEILRPALQWGTHATTLWSLLQTTIQMYLISWIEKPLMYKSFLKIFSP
jgi:hypothetical protein